MLLVKRLTQTAILPTKAHADDVGYDLYSDEDALIPAHTRAVIKTGLAIRVPSDCYGRIAPRSGLATKYEIDVGAGVIDKGYRGHVMICLINSSNKDFEVMYGMKIAQLICEKVSYPEMREVSELDSTIRGNSGFGSSGI